MGFDPADVRAMQERLAKSRRAPQAVAPIQEPILQSVMSIDVTKFDCREFTFHGEPMGKPRMTQRDKWKKRPVVLRYNAYKDALRAAAGSTPENPDLVIVTARVSMPASWSKKKKDSLEGKPCKQKPDWDNIGKAVCDTLWDEDCGIWCGLVTKYWCLEGQQSLNVKVYYAKPQ